MKTVIRIKNLRLRTFIGINESERQNKQDVVVNATIHYQGDAAADSDDINNAFNYRTATKQIITLVEGQPFLLLERLAREVLDILMSAPEVQRATVEVDKPHALRFADSVSVEVQAER